MTCAIYVSLALYQQYLKKVRQVCKILNTSRKYAYF